MNNFDVSASAADINMFGSIDLLNQDYGLLMRVKPHTDTLTFAGGALLGGVVITLQQMFQDEELKGFLENINDELVVDDDSDLILNSSWEFAHKDYAILKSSIVFILNDCFFKL